MFIAATTLVSDCCHAVIMLDALEGYECTRCMKPCNSGGTLGEYYESLEKKKINPGIAPANVCKHCGKDFWSHWAPAAFCSIAEDSDGKRYEPAD